MLCYHAEKARKEKILFSVDIDSDNYFLSCFDPCSSICLKECDSLSDKKKKAVYFQVLKRTTVKSSKQEHSKIRTCRLILWKKTPKDKNQTQTDLLQCSDEMAHLIKIFHHISVNKLITIDI